MIYEWRTYRFAPGRAADYLAAFGSEGLPIVTRHLPMLGYWLTEVGRLNVVHHLWAYADLDDRAARRASLAADAEWSAGFGPRAFPLIEQQESFLLVLRAGSRLLSDVVASARGPRPAVPDGAPLLAGPWAVFESAHEPAAPPAAVRTGLWQVIAGARPSSHFGLFRSDAPVDILPQPAPAATREILRPTIFSPLR